MLVLALSHAFAVPMARPDASPSASGPHHAQVMQFGAEGARGRATAPRGGLPVAGSSPDMTVYGYLAYWDDDLPSLPWDTLTHLALFSAEATSDGGLLRTERWDAVDDALALAEPYGVRVHLCVTNFDPTSLDALLSSPVSRSALVDELAGWVSSTGAHGVNIDFEGVPAARRDDMVDFTAELADRVGEVVLATPAVDWSGAWDYATLTNYADLFLMGYGYHWSGSSHAGPTDPLEAGAGTVWDGINSRSLTWSAADYLSSGADPTRVILGLPLYGIRWDTSTDTVPGKAVGTGTSVLFRDAWSLAETHGRRFEQSAASPWLHDGTGQVWYGDADSVQTRIGYVRDETALSGVGFWALHYTDDVDFWGMVRRETRAAVVEPGDEPVSEFVANAGRPFIAYVGDTVELSAEASTGPEGVELQYRWTQRAGPAVGLRRPASATPRFTVEQVGNVVFDLEVGDGTIWSEPVRSHVVVIDPDAARRHNAGCGCADGGAWPVWSWLPALLLLRYRHGVKRRGRRGR
ncbi:MAG: hypothetical protein KTR31_08315 [Myxococcales bacterium]|nr:hypothetical protein [Myxococcales bacterium]